MKLPSKRKVAFALRRLCRVVYSMPLLETLFEIGEALGE